MRKFLYVVIFASACGGTAVGTSGAALTGGGLGQPCVDGACQDGLTCARSGASDRASRECVIVSGNGVGDRGQPCADAFDGASDSDGWCAAGSEEFAICVSGTCAVALDPGYSPQ
jgi:hypothetical protein